MSVILIVEDDAVVAETLTVYLEHAGYEVAAAIRAAGLEGDARVRLDLPQGLSVRADPLRVRRILLDLLTNAARYTPAGGVIELRAARGALPAA